MPPVMITAVMPIAMIAITAIWLATLTRLSPRRKFGHRRAVGTNTRGEPSVGNAAGMSASTSQPAVVGVAATASSRPPAAASLPSASRALAGSPCTTSTRSSFPAFRSLASVFANACSSGCDRTTTRTRWSGGPAARIVAARRRAAAASSGA